MGRTHVLPRHRAVLAGIPVCIAAVIVVARPSFLFGGEGLRPMGVAIAALQVHCSSTSLPSRRMLHQNHRVLAECEPYGVLGTSRDGPERCCV